jgi:hypothetical protein
LSTLRPSRVNFLVPLSPAKIVRPPVRLDPIRRSSYSSTLAGSGRGRVRFAASTGVASP